MSSKKTKLELTWIGKEHRPKLEPRILLEEPDKSHHAKFRLKGVSREAAKTAKNSDSKNLRAFAPSREAQIQRSISERNASFYEEAAKLDGWADDLKAGLEREIKEFDRQIKETRRASATALTLEEKLKSQKLIKHIEAQRNEKRRSLFEAQDAIDRQREGLIEKIEGQLYQLANNKSLYTLRWILE